MLLFWRGKGWTVLPIMFAWVFFVMIVGIVMLGPEADPNAAANVDRHFALAFVLSAANLYYLAWGGAGKVAQATDPNVAPYSDDCMFIPMKYWSYGFLAVAVFFLGRSFT